MKKTFLLLSAAVLLAGCVGYYPPRTSMYSDYGFTYDYNQSPVPVATEVPATTTSAPTFLVQVPPPTVIYQTTQAPVQSSVDTNTTAEANPYKGSYLIPPKVVVVPQQTIIREAAGAAPGGGATNVTTGPAQVQPQFYPGTSYVYPGSFGVIDTNVPGTNTNTSVVVTNGITNTVVVTNGITNINTNSVVVTNINTNTVVVTNTATNPTNTVKEAAGAQRTTNAPAFAPVPAPTGTAVPPVGTTPTTTLQRPRTTQSTTGSGTGQPAQTTTGGSFAPPPPGTTPLPGTQPKQQ